MHPKAALLVLLGLECRYLHVHPGRHDWRVMEPGAVMGDRTLAWDNLSTWGIGRVGRRVEGGMCEYPPVAWETVDDTTWDALDNSLIQEFLELIR